MTTGHVRGRATGDQLSGSRGQGPAKVRKTLFRDPAIRSLGDVCIDGRMETVHCLAHRGVRTPTLARAFRLHRPVVARALPQGGGRYRCHDQCDRGRGSDGNNTRGHGVSWLGGIGSPRYAAFAEQGMNCARGGSIISRQSRVHDACTRRSGLHRWKFSAQIGWHGSPALRAPGFLLQYRFRSPPIFTSRAVQH
ncbi:hypothetical protein ebA3189 [Aromatoleum aromaticum EbN1]|uniref:Uncharacterized protein n=1 Tax=Aromatoleum aromaticum (strain DSM 19018 / LMG 30748 / EbN1) TaxID=76114 RepID=Q5P445_AROAE|nr:hypothetical protein ebA3189 [Aromatoleum aromaticum EbN1]